MTKDYWQHKLSLWLHDPVHKMFDIRHHESLASDIANLLHITTPDKATYQKADMMASGLTRAALPGYSGDTGQNGAVDFSAHPLITHPLVQECPPLRLAVGKADANSIHDGLKELLTRDLGLTQTIEELRAMPEENRPLSGFFDRRNTPEEWARALYFYLFFVLKKRLRQENIGGLGNAWDLLPADSRIPDHPLWHHLGLTSAIGSALAADPSGEIALAIFSITPVQPFISKARKLRDHWTGSVILSYLAFSGIRHIAATLGPDHIVYPSLHDQSLVEAWIGKEFHLERFLKEENEALKKIIEKSASIASFPNKLVFLCPASKVADICLEIEATVQAEWLRIAGLVRDYIARQTQCGEAMRDLFNHQAADYWQFSHAACRLTGLKDAENLARVLHRNKWQKEHDTIAAFVKNFGQSGHASARLYGATHSLAQSLLAAAKLKPAKIRNAQHGEKCPLCGEHEILHDFAAAGHTDVKEYRNTVQNFWNRIRKRENPQDGYTQVGERERLCAICAVKRFLPGVMKRTNQREELLASVFAGADTFPSTTEIAAHRYFLKLTEHVPLTENESKKLLDWFHASEVEVADDEHSRNMREIVALGKEKGAEYKDRDKYYALLLMDGDKMGDLINGATLTANWGDVIHPELNKRFDNKQFHPDSPLRSKISEKRLLNPALHAAISDALNSFARFGVAPVIERLSGRLIYAGGDDVCAILPLEAALEAADLIRQSYTVGFVHYGLEGAKEVSTNCPPGGKLAMHLGKAAKISISAAMVIAHHKTPLRETLRDTHAVLNGLAKERAGRNALAIRLKKRSGGDRDLWLQWDEDNLFDSSGKESLLQALRHLMQGVSDDLLSGSLLYRLAELKGAIAPLATDEPAALSVDGKDKIVRLIQYEIGHSGKGMSKAEQRRFAERLAGLMIRHKAGQADWFNPEAAIIARFLAEPTRREA